MQRTEHLYGTEAIAGANGIRPLIRQIIAWSAQFVDDNNFSKIVPVGGKVILPSMSAHRPFDYKIFMTSFILDIWSFFHFPGGYPDAPTFMEKMRCRKNGPLVKAMIKHALRLKAKPFGPHFAGIVAHLIFDSWAHDSFIGLYTPLNRIKNTSLRIETGSTNIKKYIWKKFTKFMKKNITNGAGMLMSTIAESVAPIGHSFAGTFPDKSFLKRLEFETESGYVVSRNNTEHFLEAFECLYEFLAEFAKDNPLCGQLSEPRSWDSISDEIKELLGKEGSTGERTKWWEEAISSGDLCLTAPPINYSSKGWSPNKVPHKLHRGFKPEKIDALLFIHAVREYKKLFHLEMVKAGFILNAS